MYLTLTGLRYLNWIELQQDAEQIVGLCRDPDALRMRGFDPASKLRSLSFKGTVTEQEPKHHPMPGARFTVRRRAQ